MALTFVESVELGVPARAALAWHFRPGAFERLAPPWQHLEVVEAAPRIEDGARTVLRGGVGPLRFRWIAEHRDVDPERGFRDVQIAGPFTSWVHRHRVEPLGADRSRLEDAIEYAPPLGRLGVRVAGPFIAAELRRLFAFRHRVTRDDLEVHARHPGEPMTVAVTGRAGLVGGALVPFLTTGAHSVRRLAALDDRPEDLAGSLAGAAAVVHLSEDVLGELRAGAERRARAVRDTRRLCEALARDALAPRLLVLVSSICRYGDRGEAPLAEDAVPGRGALAELAEELETACRPAERAGLRVVRLRLGVVLDPRGGALARLQRRFRMGAGGRCGTGRQWTSWISLEDAVDAIHHALTCRELSGACDAVAPEPVRNAELARALGRVLRRPAALPLPLGSAGEALATSARVSPRRLEESGFRFRHPRLEDALRHVFGRGPRP